MNAHEWVTVVAAVASVLSIAQMWMLLRIQKAFFELLKEWTDFKRP